MESFRKRASEHETLTRQLVAGPAYLEAFEHWKKSYRSFKTMAADLSSAEECIGYYGRDLHTPAQKARLENKLAWLNAMRESWDIVEGDMVQARKDLQCALVKVCDDNLEIDPKDFKRLHFELVKLYEAFG